MEEKEQSIGAFMTEQEFNKIISIISTHDDGEGSYCYTGRELIEKGLK